MVFCSGAVLLVGVGFGCVGEAVGSGVGYGVKVGFGFGYGMK